MQKNKCVVAWDFDLTLIDANCDFFYFDQIEPKCTEICKEHYLGGDSHVSAVNKALDYFFNEKKHTWQEIKDSFSKIPFPQSSQDSIKYLAQNGFQQIIISTANTLFIETILKMWGLDSFISRIYSNPSHLAESGQVIVNPFHTTHTCTICDKSFCKGTAFQEIITENPEPVYIYAGDSASGDYCPCSKLRTQDYAFAREAFPLQKKLSEKPVQTKNIIIWNYDNLLDQIKQVTAKIQE